jgi:hypothetical protein
MNAVEGITALSIFGKEDTGRYLWYGLDRLLAKRKEFGS